MWAAALHSEVLEAAQSLALLSFTLFVVAVQLSEHDLYLSYLPLAHIFGRVVEEAMLFHGAAIAYWQGDVKLLLDDVDAAKPTVFCGVPRVFDRVYNGEQLGSLLHASRSHRRP